MTEPLYEVVWPLGPRVTGAGRLRPRLDSLDGKTIALIWDYLFRGDEMFDLIVPELEARHPGVRFVGYEAFGNIHGPRELEENDAIPGRLIEHEADAAILAIAA
jgi:hypothetical protein